MSVATKPLDVKKNIGDRKMNKKSRRYTDKPASDSNQSNKKATVRKTIIEPIGDSSYNIKIEDDDKPTERDAMELQELLDELSPENIADLPEEVILGLRKKLNPYGRTIQGSDKILTFSYIDLRKEYLEKFLVTSLIGFLNRMCDEWNVPPGIKVVPVEEYEKNPSILDPPRKNGKINLDPNAFEEWKQNWKHMQKRCIVKEFLASIFQFNPDEHVRSAYMPNPDDNERELIKTAPAKLAIAMGKKRNAKFKEKMRIAEERDNILKTGSVDNKSKIEKEGDTKTNKNRDEVSDVRNAVTNMIPPRDIFHRWKYYQEVNYEEIRKAVEDLYCDKPIFETAINPYDWHANDEEADKFINKHKSEVTAEVFKAHSGKWNLFGKFKQVRKGMRFNNEKTQVIEEIFAQQEMDIKLGADLMKKRVKKAKDKNIKEVGPDSKAFLEWKAQNKTMRDMGAETTSDFGNVDPSCPDEAIQVNYHIHNPTSGEFQSGHFFTEAEQPEWMAEESLYKANDNKNKANEKKET